MSSQTSNKPQSRTVPAYVSFMQNIMFLDKVAQKREEDYQLGLEAALGALPKNSSKEVKQGAEDNFTRRFYAYEIARREAYIQKTQQLEALKNKQSLPDFTTEDEHTLDNLAREVGVGEQAYILAGNFEPARLERLRQEYSPLMSVLRQEIAGSQPRGVFGSEGEHRAVLELFKEKYPGLDKELSQYTMQNSNDSFKNECMVAGRVLLNGAIFAANPSGFLIGKGLNGLLQTKAMKGFTSSIGSHVDRAMKAVGVNVESKSYKMVGLAASAVIVGGLALAFGSPEQAKDLMVKAYDQVFDTGEALAAMDIGESYQPDVSEVSPNNAVSSNVDNDVPKSTAENPPEVKKEVDPDPPKEPLPIEINAREGTDHGETDVKVQQQGAREMQVEQSSPEQQVEQKKTVGECNMPIGEDGAYTIQSGDTLSDIVERELKQAGVPYNYTMIDNLVDRIVESNDNITNSDKIFPGQDINLPVIEGVERVVEPQVAPTAEPTQSQEVKQESPDYTPAFSDDIEGQYVTDPHEDYSRSLRMV